MSEIPRRLHPYVNEQLYYVYWEAIDFFDGEKDLVLCLDTGEGEIMAFPRSLILEDEALPLPIRTMLQKPAKDNSILFKDAPAFWFVVLFERDSVICSIAAKTLPKGGSA